MAMSSLAVEHQLAVRGYKMMGPMNLAVRLELSKKWHKYSEVRQSNDEKSFSQERHTLIVIW